MDFEVAKDNFIKYTLEFESMDNKVNIKRAHSFGVAQIAEYIAKELNLSNEDVELARLIGLLHDIGRFEQAKIFDNFNDYETIDHAELGVQVLFKDNFIRKFIETDKYDDIIKVAIRNHNKYELPQGLEGKELLHSKIIRDADKTDNFTVKEKQDLFSLFRTTDEEFEKEKISDPVWNDFLSGKSILSRLCITNMDKWVSYIAWIYDYNFLPGLKYLQNNNCIDRVLDRYDYKDPDTKEKIEYARKVAKEYINSKIRELSEEV